MYMTSYMTALQLRDLFDGLFMSRVRFALQGVPATSPDFTAVEALFHRGVRAISGLPETTRNAVAERLAGYRSLRTELAAHYTRELWRQREVREPLLFNLLPVDADQRFPVPLDPAVSFPAPVVDVKASDDTATKRGWNDHTLRLCGPMTNDLVIFTDGSTLNREDSTAVGVAVFVIPAAQRDTAWAHALLMRTMPVPSELHPEHAPPDSVWRLASTFAPGLSCSFRTEADAIRLALRIVADVGAPGARVVTDSLSTLRALERGHLGQNDVLPQLIWAELLRLCDASTRSSVSFTFLFSHTMDAEDLPDSHGNLWHWAIWGNGVADACAAWQRTRVAAPCIAPWWAMDRARLDTTVIETEDDDAVLLPDWWTPVGKAPRFKRQEAKFLPPKTFRLVQQLRAGVVPSLGGHLHDRPEPCRVCGEPNALRRGGVAVRHLFDCPGLAAARLHLSIHGVQVVWERPQVAVSYLESYLALLPE